MRYQFKLSALLFALFYAAGLSALTVRFAGSGWLTEQTVAAYVTIVIVTLALFFSLRGKLRPAGYLLFAPLLVVCALVAASMFSPPQLSASSASIGTVPRVTTGVSTTNPPLLSPSPLTGGNR